MSWRGGAVNPPQTQADTSRTAVPTIPGYLVWGDGLQLHARSNVHATAHAAAAAGVPWYVVAFSAQELVDAVSKPARGEHNP